MARFSVHAVSSISTWNSSCADALAGVFDGRTVTRMPEVGSTAPGVPTCNPLRELKSSLPKRSAIVGTGVAVIQMHFARSFQMVPSAGQDDHKETAEKLDGAPSAMS